MQKENNSPIICSNCQQQIEKNFCSECGQFYNPKRLNASGFISDLLDTFFALNKSYGMNLKDLLLRPRFVVENYWNGYRNFYFSPNRMLLITTFFIALYLYFNENSFLGTQISLVSYPWIGIELFVTCALLFFFILSTMITYFRRKKNLFEHLALNAYVFSFVTILFLILSIALEYFNLGEYRQIFFTFFYCIWIARVFEHKWWKILGMAALNLAVFLAMTYVPLYLLFK